MEKFVWEMINIIVTGVQAFIFFDTFRKIFSLKNKKSVYVYFSLSILALVVMDRLLPLYDLYEAYYYLIWFLILYICSVLFLQGNLFRILIVVLAVVISYLCIQFVIIFVYSIIIKQSYYDISEMFSPIWFFATSVSYILFYIITRLIIAVFNRKKPSFPVQELCLLGLFVAIMVFAGILLLPNYEHIEDPQSTNNIRVALLVMILVLLNIVFWGYVFYSRRVLKYKIDLAVQKNQLDEQRRRMEDIKEQENQIRKIRHDYKNHVVTGLELMRDGKTQEADRYFSEYLDSVLTASRQFINTKSESVNAVVNKKFTQCFEMGIKVSFCVTGEIGNVSEMDLCVVLFNLLDNAIEGCSENLEESHIKLEMYQNKAYFIARVSNTIIHSVVENNPKLKTTKSDDHEHGIGLGIVKDICEKYNGMFNIEEKDNMFIAEVWLFN